MNSEDEANHSWEPPIRPDWSARINEEGACLDLREVVPLDEKSLREAAKRSTGLSDFGDPEWVEPFRVYLKALNEEADLTLLGRMRIRQEILLYLKAHLQIESTYKRYPDIGAEEIRKPIILIGHGRCGASLLHNVLAANPEFKTLRYWEMLFPCPPPEAATYESDPRIELADRWMKQWYRLVPQLSSTQELAANRAFECSVLMSIAFSSPGWLSAFAQVPSFHAHIARSDPLIPLRLHRRALKLLQWRNPRKHWVLKDAFHLARIESLLKIYPDALLVWVHRDPVRATASFINMLRTMQWAGSDTPLRRESLRVWDNPVATAGLFNGVIDLLERGALPAKQICHVHYTSLLADPLGVVESIHRQLDVPLTEQGRACMARYVANALAAPRRSNSYPLPRGTALERARHAFKRYQDYFGIANE